MSNSLKIFICYAREDLVPLELLRKKLAPLVHSGRIQVWYDREITGGKEWDHEIRFNLKTADIVLLLISDDFYESDYIKSVELREALDGHARQENVVVPVILYDCLWDAHYELSRLQALPDEAKPIFVEEHWKKPDMGFANVARGVLRILDDPATLERRQRKLARLEELAAAEATAREAEAARLRLFVPETVLVKGGTFTMGCTKEQGGDCQNAEKPAHQVTVSDFYIGRAPVTLTQFKAFIDESEYRTEAEQGDGSYILKGSEWTKTNGVDWRCDEKGKPRPKEAYEHPVIHVSWNDAVAYCEWLSGKNAGRFRLPTEAEWEYAARGGTLSKGFKYAGSNDLNEVAWYSGNSGSKTHHVAQKKPNELGLHDMSGNVSEWCEDDWHGNYKDAPVDGSAWVDSPQRGLRRVLRGGSWIYLAERCRVSRRLNSPPDNRIVNGGFRVAFVP